MKKFKGTTGEWSIDSQISTRVLCNEGVTHVDVRHYEDKLIEAEANAKLITDAGNTIQKCDLLPSELLKQRDELREALSGLLHIINCSSGVSGYHLNGDLAEWAEFKEVNNADKVLKNTK